MAFFDEFPESTLEMAARIVMPNHLLETWEEDQPFPESGLRYFTAYQNMFGDEAAAQLLEKLREAYRVRYRITTDKHERVVPNVLQEIRLRKGPVD